MMRVLIFALLIVAVLAYRWRLTEPKCYGDPLPLCDIDHFEWWTDPYVADQWS